MIRRRIAAARASDSGLTLPELLVTMFLMGIIGTLVASLLSTFSTTMTREQARMDSTNVASSGMNEVARIIRAGTAVEWKKVGMGGQTPMVVFAGKERLVLISAVDATAADPRPLQVEFSLDAARVLTEIRTTARKGTAPLEPAWVFSGAGTATTSRAIARKIVAPSVSVPYLFVYRDKDGNVMTPAGTGSLSEADRTKIASVEVSLTVQADPTGRADPVQLINKVSVTNFGLGPMGVS